MKIIPYLVESENGETIVCATSQAKAEKFYLEIKRIPIVEISMLDGSFQF